MIRKYKHRQTGEIIEAVTFDELVEHGRQQNPGREGMPWSFDIWGCHVTHETDTRYRVGSIALTPGNMIAHQQGNIYLWGAGSFSDVFDPVTAELDIIEATEKSAQMMLGMAARARGAVRLELELAEARAEIENLNRHIEQEHCAAWRQIQAALPEPELDDGRSLVQRAVDTINDLRQHVNRAEERAGNGRQAVTIAALRDAGKTSTQDAIHWNPYNEVVHDHRDGTIIQPDTDKERAKRGLPPFTPDPGPQTLRDRICDAINRTSAENESDTPDFILADYLMAALGAFDAAVLRREEWCGRKTTAADVDLAPPAEPLHLEVGKTYVRQDGALETIVKEDTELPGAWRFRTISGQLYREDGLYSVMVGNLADLVTLAPAVDTPPASC